MGDGSGPLAKFIFRFGLAPPPPQGSPEVSGEDEAQALAQGGGSWRGEGGRTADSIPHYRHCRWDRSLDRGCGVARANSPVSELSGPSPPRRPSPWSSIFVIPGSRRRAPWRRAAASLEPILKLARYPGSHPTRGYEASVFSSPTGTLDSERVLLVEDSERKRGRWRPSLAQAQKKEWWVSAGNAHDSTNLLTGGPAPTCRLWRGVHLDSPEMGASECGGQRMGDFVTDY